MGLVWVAQKARRRQWELCRQERIAIKRKRKELKWTLKEHKPKYQNKSTIIYC